VKKPIIVGYDPGTTAALAIIDTKGEILLLKSKRGFKKGEVIDAITSIGKPLMVSGDRHPLPKGVEKLASSLGCRSFHPRKSLTNIEKGKLVHNFTEKIENNHEKDALASALEAFKYHSRLFERADGLLSSLGLSELYDKVVQSVIIGEVENITEAINRTLTELRRKVPKVSKRKVVERSILENTVLRLQKKIKRLEKDALILKKYNQGLKNKLKDSERRITYYKKKLTEKLDLDSLGTIKKSMDRLKDELEQNKSLIEQLRLFRKLELSGYIPIIELNEIRDSIAKDLNPTIDLGDRVILVNRLENVQVLNDYKIKALIVLNEPSERILEKVNFPIVIKKDISIEKVKNISVVKEKEFEEKIKQARKTGFVKWLKGHKKRRL